jgi:hypothetical protein
MYPARLRLLFFPHVALLRHAVCGSRMRCTASGQQSTDYQVPVGRLKAVREAVTSEVAARRRSGSDSAIGKHIPMCVAQFTATDVQDDNSATMAPSLILNR